MKRLSAASLRKLDQLEKPRVAGGGKVLVVPKLLDLETWQAQAMAYFASRAEAEALDRRESDAAYQRALTTAAPPPPSYPIRPIMRNT